MDLDSELTNKKWGFVGSTKVSEAAALTLRGWVGDLMANVRPDGPQPVLPLGHGDPGVYPEFRTSIDAQNSIAATLASAKFNAYAASGGETIAKRGIVDYLNPGLAYKLKEKDVFLTVGCNQAIEIMLDVLTRPKANILFPRPGFPQFEARALFSNIEARHFDLLPEKDWEIDLEGVEKLADENTVAMVIINPCNPCGNVYTFDQLEKVAETARKLGIMVISDEVYRENIYGDSTFVTMGKFATTVPIITIGALSKGWFTPGWKLGWIALNDPYRIFDKTGIVKSITDCVNITPDPATFIQAALPGIFENTKESFFHEKGLILKGNAELAIERINKEIDCLTPGKKPESTTYLLAKINLHRLEGIKDDIDFCMQLANEQSVIVLPGIALGLKNWVRITTGVQTSTLEDGLNRMKKFYDNHAMKVLEKTVEDLKLN